jgi:hypothetical protein
MQHAIPIQRRAFALLVLLIGLAVGTPRSHAQALPTATAPGEYMAIGGGGSLYQVDYGQRLLGGLDAYVDINPTWRYGIEGEARFLRYNTSEQVTETNYLIGPRVSFLPRRSFHPYAKFLVGDGHIVLPFHYAEGDLFALAPGAGLDYTIRDRFIVRVVDFEYQMWPQFTFGSLHPYGLSAGLSIRLNSIPRFPNGHRLAR